MVEDPKAVRPWSTWELRYLLRNAGRIPKQTLFEKLEREPAEIERVIARLRQLGLPVYLSFATCPMCGRIAPLVPHLGICEPCNYVRRLAKIQDATTEIFSLLPSKDQAIYIETEADRGGRIIESMPKPVPIPEGASPLERMRAEDKRIEDLVRWQAKNLHRELRAAQKRKERMARKAIEHGADVSRWHLAHAKKQCPEHPGDTFETLEAQGREPQCVNPPAPATS